MKIETIAIHGGYTPEATTKAVAVPIYQTTSYAFDDTQHGADLFDLKVPGNIYTRIMNPTTAVLEQRVAAMEGGVGALAVASGMAAITYTLMTIAEVGDNIVGMQYFDVTPMFPTDSSTQQDLLPGETRTCSFTKPSPGIDPEKLPKVKKLVAIPANDIAKSELHPRVFNIIILGAVIAATEVLPLDAIKKALDVKLADKFANNEALRTMNFKALDRGYELVKSAM